MNPNREQLVELARVLAETASHEINCEEVLDRIASYLEAHIAGQPLPTELSLVAQHLRVCPECHEQFQALVRSVE